MEVKDNAVAEDDDKGGVILHSKRMKWRRLYKIKLNGEDMLVKKHLNGAISFYTQQEQVEVSK